MHRDAFQRDQIVGQFLVDVFQDRFCFRDGLGAKLEIDISHSDGGIDLASLGARSGMLLDGGGSSTMFIGEEARRGARGTVVGGWRPVATFFGVRARPLSSVAP